MDLSVWEQAVHETADRHLGSWVRTAHARGGKQALWWTEWKGVHQLEQGSFQFGWTGLLDKTSGLNSLNVHAIPNTLLILSLICTLHVWKWEEKKSGLPQSQMRGHSNWTKKVLRLFPPTRLHGQVLVAPFYRWEGREGLSKVTQLWFTSWLKSSMVYSPLNEL